MLEKKKIIINLVKEHNTLTKPQISEMMSVSLTTINKYVNELVEKKFLMEEVLDRKKTEGKPPSFYKINTSYGKLMAVYLEKDKLEILVTDNLGNIQESRIFNIENRNSFTERILCAEILKAIKELGLKDCVKVISIGIPGILGEDNKITEIPSFPKLEGKNIIAALNKKLKVPVIIENDINLTIKALHSKNQYKNYKNLVYFFIKNNIGGGVISDGTLYKGYSNLSGEFAYLGVDKEYLSEYKVMNSENAEKYFVEKMKSEEKIEFLLFVFLRIIVTLNPEILFIETSYIQKNEIKILNEKLETFFNKTYLPKIILVENNGLGEEGTITNALEIFYSKD
jgi:hypothetical protein